MSAGAGLSRLRTVRGMRFWQWSSGFSAVYSAITAGAYGTGYALHLGASDALVGLLSAAPGWGQTLQLAAPLLIERLRGRKALCLVTYGIAWSLWLPIALIPAFVPQPYRAWVFVGCVLLSGLLTAIASPAVTSWFGDMIPSELRGGYVSRNQSTVATVGLVASLAAGALMDQFPDQRQQTGFTLLFLLAVLAAWGSLATWAAVPDPPKQEAAIPTVRDLFRLPWRSIRFRNYTIFVGVRTFSIFIASPFFAAYMLKDLSIPYSRIALFSMAVTLATILSNPIWASLAAKYGHRPMLRISTFGVALIPFIWFWTSPTNYLWMIPLWQLWAGIMAAGLVQSQFNLLLKLSPAANRSIYLGFHNTVVNVAMALGSMVGGWLAGVLEGAGPYHFAGREVSHYQVLFLIASVGRLLVLPLLGLVREPYARSAWFVFGQLLRGRSMQALWHLRRLTGARDPSVKASAARALGRAGSPLPVEELVAGLDDPDHEVRREAARALGVIGEERAVEALLAKALDLRGDITEEAVEALSLIRGPTSRAALIGLLGDERPSIRRGAAQGLGRVGVADDVEVLEERAAVEGDPAVRLALDEAMALLGGPRALRRLRRQLPLTAEGPARHQVANSIGNLLGPQGAFYRLLEAEPIAQEVAVADLLRAARRTLGGFKELRAGRHDLFAQLDAAHERFGAEAYHESCRLLRRVVSRAVQAVADGRTGAQVLADHPDHHDELAPTDKRHLLLEQTPPLRLPFSYLHNLDRAGAHRPLDREEGLLAAYAFSRVVEELGALRRR